MFSKRCIQQLPEHEQHSDLCNSFSCERAFFWISISTQVKGQHKSAHSSISNSCVLHIENITLYFTRGLRTEHLLSYSVQAEYVQQTCFHQTKDCECERPVSKPTQNKVGALEPELISQSSMILSSFLLP